MRCSNNQPSSLFSHFQARAVSPFCRARKLHCKVNQRLINFLMSLTAKRSCLSMVRSPNHQSIYLSSLQMHNPTIVWLVRLTTRTLSIVRLCQDPRRVQLSTPIWWMASHRNCHILMKMIKITPMPNFPLEEKTKSCSRPTAPSSSTTWVTSIELMTATLQMAGSLFIIRAFSKTFIQTIMRILVSKWFKSITRKVRNLKRNSSHKKNHNNHSNWSNQMTKTWVCPSPKKIISETISQKLDIVLQQLSNGLTILFTLKVINI